MNKADISKTAFRIKDVKNVISSQANNLKKPLFVDGRHSDAFVLVLSGGCKYTLEDGSQITAKAGDVLYLAQSAKYRMDYLQDEKYKFTFCDFEFDSQTPRACAVFHLENPAPVEQLFKRLLIAYAENGADFFAESASILYAVYAAVIRSQNAAYLQRSARMRAENGKRLIDLHCGDNDLTVAAVAEKLDVSEVYFRKLFKAKYGQTPSEYIASARLQKAIGLMEYPFLPLEECAKRSGFSSYPYFNKVFKAHFGVTPAKYKKQRGK